MMVNLMMVTGNSLKSIILIMYFLCHREYTRSEANNMLSQEQFGTFLVRKSDQGLVLSCKTPQKVVHLLIFDHPDNKVSIDKKQYFDSIKHLISHYKSKPLMNGIKLVEPIYDLYL